MGEVVLVGKCAKLLRVKLWPTVTTEHFWNAMLAENRLHCLDDSRIGGCCELGELWVPGEVIYY